MSGGRPPGGSPARSSGGDGPAHPKLAAALLMVGIVLFIVVVSALSVVG